MSRPTTRWYVAVALALTVAACDSGPKGPGSLTGTVTGAPFGGVVLSVDGAGIEAFDGLGNTRAYGAPLLSAPDRHRVVLVDPAGGTLRFEIRVQDLGMEDPVITVLVATDTDNAMISTGAAVVTIER